MDLGVPRSSRGGGTIFSTTFDVQARTRMHSRATGRRKRGHSRESVKRERSRVVTARLQVRKTRTGWASFAQVPTYMQAAARVDASSQEADHSTNGALPRVPVGVGRDRARA